MTSTKTSSPGWRAALPIVLALAGAAFPAFFHRTAALGVGPYGGIAPVNWVRFSTVWLVGLVLILLLALLLWRMSKQRFTTLLLPSIAAYWAVAFFWRGNAALAGLVNLPGRIVTGLAVVVLIAGVWLLVKLVSTSDGPNALAIALAVPMAFTGWQAVGFTDLPAPEPSEAVLVPTDDRPDVWVIVLDALPSPATLERLGWDAQPFVSELERLGFQVPMESASYSSGTFVTVGAALTLGDVPPTSPIGVDELGPWLAAMRGDHPLARGLVANGYDFVTVDNAFSFSECGPVTTDCRRYPLISEHELSALQNSLAAPFLPDTHPWTEHTLRQLDELAALADEDNLRPRLVYTHLLMPHWPFDHDATCEPAEGSELDEWVRSPIGFGQTMDCLSSRLVDLAGRIPADDVVVMLGDHGSDLYNPSGGGFDADQLADRLSAFVAVSGCELEAEHLSSNVNAYRGVSSCVTTGDFPPWPADPHLACPQLSGDVRLISATEALAAGTGLSCNSD